MEAAEVKEEAEARGAVAGEEEAVRAAEVVLEEAAVMAEEDVVTGEDGKEGGLG